MGYSQVHNNTDCNFTGTPSNLKFIHETGIFTLCGWLTTDVSGGFGARYNYISNNLYSDVFLGFNCQLLHNGSGDVALDMKIGDGSLSQYAGTSGFSIDSATKLYHFAFVGSGTGANSGTWYLDGAVANTPSVAAWTAGTGDANTLRLSYAAASSARTATFRDTRIYNRALTANEIKTIFNSRGTDGIQKGLQFRTRFHAKIGGTTWTAGSTEYDISPNKFVGTRSGTGTGTWVNDNLSIGG